MNDIPHIQKSRLFVFDAVEGSSEGRGLCGGRGREVEAEEYFRVEWLIGGWKYRLRHISSLHSLNSDRVQNASRNPLRQDSLMIETKVRWYGWNEFT